MENKENKYRTDLYRKIKGSNNFEKQRKKLKNICEKISNIKKDFFKKLSKYLVENYNTIIIDDFNYQKVISNKIKGVNKAAQRTSPTMFKNILKYKAEDYLSVIKYIPKYTITTQKCSKCGKILNNKLELKNRVFSCDCGFIIDRDINSSINIYNYIFF